MSKSFSDLFFESFVPPFKVSNMIGLGHVATNPRCRFSTKESERLRECDHLTYIYPKAPAHLSWRSRSPRRVGSPLQRIVKSILPKRLCVKSGSIAVLFLSLREAVGRRWGAWRRIVLFGGPCCKGHGPFAIGAALCTRLLPVGPTRRFAVMSDASGVGEEADTGLASTIYRD